MMLSFTSIVSYMFRIKAVRVCAIPLGVVYASALFHLSSNIWSPLHATVSSAICGISSAGLHLVFQHRYCHQEFSVAFCCAVAQFLLLDGLKQVAFGRCGLVSAIHHTCLRINGSPSYSGPSALDLFTLVQLYFLFLQRRSHHTVRSGKYTFCRCSCPHRVLNFSVHTLSITTLHIFHSPRPLRIIGMSIDIRRHTARWTVNGATMASTSSFLSSSSRVA